MSFGRQEEPQVGKDGWRSKVRSLAQCVSEFHNEHLQVSTGKLFCGACREELGLKASVIHLVVVISREVPCPERK